MESDGDSVVLGSRMIGIGYESLKMYHATSSTQQDDIRGYSYGYG